MGFSGHFLVACRRTSLFELPVVGGIEPGRDEYGHDGYLGVCERFAGGWQVLQAEYGLPEDRDWLRVLVGQTRAPVLIASVSDSCLCTVRGLEPGSAAPWSAQLHSEGRRSPSGRDGESPASAREWMRSDRHLTGAEAVDAVAGWSAAAGFEPDPEQLTAALDREPENSVEEVFFRLLSAAGLCEVVEELEDDCVHSLATGWRDPAKLRLAIAVMKPGMRRALECTQHQDCFVKVLLQPDGVYELEYREPPALEHFVAVTPSLDKVVEAMTAWSASELGWRADFEWSSVGGDAESAEDPASPAFPLPPPAALPFRF